MENHETTPVVEEIIVSEENDTRPEEIESEDTEATEDGEGFNLDLSLPTLLVGAGAMLGSLFIWGAVSKLVQKRKAKKDETESEEPIEEANEIIEGEIVED